VDFNFVENLRTRDVPDFYVTESGFRNLCT